MIAFLCSKPMYFRVYSYQQLSPCVLDLVALDRSIRRAATAMTTPPLIISNNITTRVTLKAMDRAPDNWTVIPCPKSRCRAHLTPMNPLPSSMGEWTNSYFPASAATNDKPCSIFLWIDPGTADFLFVRIELLLHNYRPLFAIFNLPEKCSCTSYLR